MRTNIHEWRIEGESLNITVEAADLVALLEIGVICKKCGHRTKQVIEEIIDSSVSCVRCDEALFEARRIEGLIYVLSNESMPGLVKVGLTTRPLAERLAELNAPTSVPTPFVVEAYFQTASPSEHEASAHELLKDFRVPGREFFRCAVPRAVQAATEVVGEPPNFRETMFASSPRTHLSHH